MYVIFLLESLRSDMLQYEEKQEIVSIFSCDVQQIVAHSVTRIYEIFATVDQKLEIKKQIMLNCV